VIAVRVRVDDGYDPRLLEQWPHRGEHAPGEPRIPERVNQQGRAVADNQSRVAFAEQSIGL
jgi:hypothetical protein